MRSGRGPDELLPLDSALEWDEYRWRNDHLIEHLQRAQETLTSLPQGDDETPQLHHAPSEIMQAGELRQQDGMGVERH